MRDCSQFVGSFWCVIEETLKFHAETLKFTIKTLKFTYKNAKVHIQNAKVHNFSQHFSHKVPSDSPKFMVYNPETSKS